MIFPMVGTQFPFDRLVRAVADAVGRKAIEADFPAQVGQGGCRPSYMSWVETLEREAFPDCVAKPVLSLVMPESARFLLQRAQANPCL